MLFTVFFLNLVYKNMKRLLLFCVFIHNLSCFAQKEANNWCFGINTGLSFNTSVPVSFNSQINTSEGCSSISDHNGNLLFYTDGVTVFNRNHVAMPNGTGLLGFASSTQSAIIIRKPGSHSVYYIFTADGTSNALSHHMENGYRYSIVDMSLNGGLGDITAKNVLLYAPSTERLCAIKHADGVGVWIMTHEWNSSKFVAYLLTCNGLEANSVVSDVGNIHQYQPGLWYEAIGQMKFSPNGKKLAVAIQGQLRVQVLDFDNSTGQLSNAVNILAYWPDHYLQPGNGDAFDFEDIYGIEFSPNSKMLYISCIASDKLFQYDITPGTTSGISATGIRLYGPGPWCTSYGPSYSCPGSHAGLQLGPDGKIYIAYKPNAGLPVISDPDLSGTACNIVKSPTLTNVSNYGLPAIVTSYLNGNVMRLDSQVCERVKVSTDLPDNMTYYWDFGDTLSTADTSSMPNPEYVYQDSGSYTIKLVISNSSGCADTLKQDVQIRSCIVVPPPPPPPSEPPPLVTTYTVPNVFTPNSDGVNDTWGIQFSSIKEVKNFNLKIYNRWGQLLLSSELPNTVWDGRTVSGILCSDGVYFFICSFDLAEEKKVFKGDITLIK